LNKIQSLRGMNDCLPEETIYWQYLEERVRSVFQRYGYREIRFPLLESTDLFKRSIGEVTDIVEKEMYTFTDLSEEKKSITLRPEGTAGVVRASEQHGLLYNQVQRLWYGGPMFRYEKPQKGRLRQFHQMGVEVFGMTGPDIDAEVIALTADLWRELGIADVVSLQINSIGSNQARAVYREQLVSYLKSVFDQLDDDSKRRVDTNPMRVLDSKNPNTQDLLAGAPNILDYLDEDSQAHLSGLRKLLDGLGIAYDINPRLVRGLDYYCKTVFEWVTNELGAQGTVCAGGRYDGLVEQLGGKPTPGVGFAMGLERLVLLVQERQAFPDAITKQLDAYVVVDPQWQLEAFQLAERLRRELPALRIQTHCGGGSFKSQMKKADKSGAEFALLLGESEVQEGVISVKPLRQDSGQYQTSIEEFINNYRKEC